MARFEVLGRKTDRELIRSVAKCLAEEGPEADRLRAVINRCLLRFGMPNPDVKLTLIHTAGYLGSP